MLNSQTNLAAVALQGIDPSTVRQTSLLPEQLKLGCIDALTKGSIACRHWVVERAYALNPPSLVDALAMGSLVGIGHVSDDDPSSDAGTEASGDEMAFPTPKKASARSVPGFFVGAELRRNLALWPNELVNVVSPLGELGPQGPVPKSRPFRVVGWFESGMLEFDTKLAYASLPAVQAYMGVGDVASAIQVKVADLEGARAVRDRLRAALPGHVRVSDWQERNRNLFSALKLEKVAMFLVLTINILLAAFSIMSTLVMTIIERKREVAILKAMGAHTRSVLRIFMSQGLFTGVVGSAVGTVIGVGGGLTVIALVRDDFFKRGGEIVAHAFHGHGADRLTAGVFKGGEDGAGFGAFWRKTCVRRAVMMREPQGGRIALPARDRRRSRVEHPRREWNARRFPLYRGMFAAKPDLDIALRRKGARRL